MIGNRSKAPEKNHPGQKPSDNKPPRVIEEIIARYAVDANLFRLGSTNPKKRNPTPVFFVVFFRLLYRGLIVGRLLSGWLLSGGF